MLPTQLAPAESLVTQERGGVATLFTFVVLFHGKLIASHAFLLASRILDLYCKLSAEASVLKHDKHHAETHDT